MADRHLGGSGALDVIIRHDAVDHFKRLDAFSRAHRLSLTLAAHQKVNYAEAMDIPIEQVHRAFTGRRALPDRSDQLAQELLFLELSRSETKDDILSPYVNFDYTATRIHLRTPNLGSGEITRLMADLTRLTDSDHSDEVLLTGFNAFLQALGDEILLTQTTSLALACFFVFVIFIFQFGWRIGMLGFLSNIAALASILGIIAWSGAGFNFTTVLVASITLGLAVDDSIHFLHNWRHRRLRGADAQAAREGALQLTGWAMIITSILFCAGAAVFLLSELALLVQFAIFMMVGLALSLWTSILLLPALLALSAPRPKP